MTVRHLNYSIILVACLPSFLLPYSLSLNDILLSSFFVVHLSYQVGKLSFFLMLKQSITSPIMEVLWAEIILTEVDAIKLIHSACERKGLIL